VRSLIHFILRNHVAFLFVLLEAFCFLLIIRNNNLQREKYLSSANFISGAFFSASDAVSQYFNLVHVNKSLAEENAALRQKLKVNYLPSAAIAHTVTDTSLLIQYSYIVAKVVNNTTSLNKNYLTLNRGSKHGIVKDMAVISPKGIVGIVDAVSDNYSTVISVLNTNYKISAKFKKNNYFGSAYWEGGDIRQAFLAEIPYHANVEIGDTIVTNGYSAIYPPGIPIGTVSSFAVSREDNFFDIIITLSVDFKNVGYVYAVNNYLRGEQLSIEKRTGND
jgi:rod shape-determining protein MreC